MIERFELMCSDASALAAAVLILCSSPLVADHIYPCIVDGCCRSKSVGDSRSQMACVCRHSWGSPGETRAFIAEESLPPGVLVQSIECWVTLLSLTGDAGESLRRLSW